MSNSVAGVALPWLRGGSVGEVTQTYYTGSVSAATVGWGVAPFACYISGYWSQDAAAVAAANNVLIYTGTAASGGLVATVAVASGGGPGDTYSWAAATPQTVIAAGQPISFNFNTTVLGTAYGQILTVVYTKVAL
jgi:hypothetical protein